MKEHPAARADRTDDLVMEVDPFEIFCAYHLGLSPNGERKFLNVHQVAQRFSLGVDDVQHVLQSYGLDPDTLIRSAFDLASAQADISVSPDGVDLLHLARMHYEALLATTEERDWDAELREDAAANAKMYDEE